MCRPRQIVARPSLVDASNDLDSALRHRRRSISRNVALSIRSALSPLVPSAKPGGGFEGLGRSDTTAAQIWRRGAYRGPLHCSASTRLSLARPPIVDGIPESQGGRSLDRFEEELVEGVDPVLKPFPQRVPAMNRTDVSGAPSTARKSASRRTGPKADQAALGNVSRGVHGLSVRLRHRLRGITPIYRFPCKAAISEATPQGRRRPPGAAIRSGRDRFVPTSDRKPHGNAGSARCSTSGLGPVQMAYPCGEATVSDSCAPVCAPGSSPPAFRAFSSARLRSAVR